jgi:RNA polymerase sigma-70 factor (ECF subfamily)
MELVKLLPAPQRAVIMARVVEGKKFREVADSLGCPLNTALARMHEGLKKLRQLWEARHA